jgi:hypothetical protein
MEDVVFTMYFLSALLIGLVIGDGLWRVFRILFPRH